MPTTPLQRAMFAQGDMCFFCNRHIPPPEVSLDHLVPKSKSGTDHSGNLVGCCKTLNGIFGDMSLKEKIQTILNQKGKFVCPNLPKPQPTPAQLPQKAKLNGQQPAIPATGCAASRGGC